MDAEQRRREQRDEQGSVSGTCGVAAQFPSSRLRYVLAGSCRKDKAIKLLHRSHLNGRAVKQRRQVRWQAGALPPTPK